MGTIEKLHPPSFRGITFLYSSETRTGGKKIAMHEFVNNDNRFVEELGELPPSFSIEAIVSGDDAIQRRLDLERVLTIPGLGTLVHPIYGNIQVKSTTFTVSSNQRDIGRFTFSINFERSEANVTVAPDIPTNSAVSGASEEARTALFDSLEGNYTEPQIPDTVDSSAVKLTEILDDVGGSISSTVNTIQEGVSEFTAIINEAKTEVFSIVQEGVKLKSALQEVYASALSVVSSAATLYDAWLDLIDFGSVDIQGDVNTVFRLNKENDLSVQNEHTRINALINLYEATVYRDYETDQDLQDAQDILDETFTKLMRNYDQDIDSAVNILAKDPNVRQKMSELRTIARQVIEQKEKNVWKVVQINPGLSSMALISYRYYASLENLSLIETLNNDVNWSNSDQEIQAVSQ